MLLGVGYEFLVATIQDRNLSRMLSPAAVKTYRRAATLARLTGDWALAAVALAGLAEVYRATGRQAEADDVLQEVAQLAPGTDATPAGEAESG